MFNIIPRLVDRKSDGVPMVTTTVPMVSMCAYLCKTNHSCKVFHYHNDSQECGLYNSQNHRDVGLKVGTKHFQLMPKECVPGIDEWFPDINQCIYLHTTTTLYADAQGTCHSMSRELMSIYDVKYLGVKTVMQKLNILAIHTYARRVGAFSYEWRDGSAVTQHWCPSEPFEDRDCVGLIETTWCPEIGLDDSSCTKVKRVFFCEK
ncbi:C-type mannose receptor 2-like [Saccostrea cucullata]|uniref:C-type mannose receptor 2-like n=1 Tax=Saccostrea cuccullata TaxID=36930 RepID=UPI002ED31C9A